MSSNSVDVNTLVEAVGEDPRLKPFEKETHIGFTKDGSPTTAATRFDQHVARVFTEEAGISRRLLQHPHFEVTGIRVKDSLGDARSIEPDNFCGGKVTAVGGYVPIGTVKLQKRCRSTLGHASVVFYQRQAANSSQPLSSLSSGGVTEERIAMDSRDNSDDDSEDVSDYKVTDPLDW
jgi:hypothetical protein